jgi:hypothetical protein
MTKKWTLEKRFSSLFVRACALACLVALSYASASAQTTVAYYRFEEGTGTDVVDSVTSTDHGDLVEEATFSNDVPSLDGVANLFSADFTAGGRALIDGTSFIFHEPTGDATLEWFLKLPVPHHHATIFWSNADDTATNENRFNIFWNADFTTAPESERFVSGDYNSPAPVESAVIATSHDNGVPLVVGVWHHIAIVRTDDGGGSYTWKWYINGTLSAGHGQQTTIAALPTAATWTMAARSAGTFRLAALIDEVRITAGALEPEDFLFTAPPCPPTGDTHCVGVMVDPPGGDAGPYTVTTSATDDSVPPDAVFYSFTVDNGIDPPKTQGPKLENTAAFNLGLGSWTISVSVDDDPLCEDVAVDATCNSVNVEVTTVAPADPVYLRFEEGTGTDVVDSESSAVVGTLVGESARWSPDAPCSAGGLVGGDDNLFSADFTLGGFAEITEAAFLFHDVSGGGTTGDATLEWFLKVPAAHAHASIFWTNGDDPNDDNRVNIYWNTGTPAPDSDRSISADYDDPFNSGAVAMAVHDNGVALSLDEWHHMALVRTANGGGSYSWKWYIDGVLSEEHGELTTLLRFPDSSSWLICGRQGGHGLGAYIDEVRLTPAALTPAQFLACAGVQGAQLAGDCNQDGSIDLSDVICLLGHLFQGNPEDLACATTTANLALMDCNQDGGIDLSDAIFKLTFLFQGGPPPVLGVVCFGIPNCPQNPGCP